MNLLRKKTTLCASFLTLVVMAGICINYYTNVNAQTAARCVSYIVSDYGNMAEKFFTIDLPSRTVTPLDATYPGNDMFEAVEVDPSNDTIYAITQYGYLPNPGYLMRVDGNTGNVTPVGPTGFIAIEAMTFRSDGTLWGWDKRYGLVRINKSTGAGTLVYRNGTNFSGMAWNRAGTLLYLSLQIGELWTYNPSTQELTQIATNLPPEADSLEMRPDGLLMSGHRVPGSQLGVYNYDPNSRSIVSEVLISTPYADVESIAWPESCGLPENPGRRTPTPTVRPSTPPPTRTATPTRSPSPTPTRSPSPTPTPLPRPACAPNNCTDKKIGVINGLNGFVESDNAEENQPYWVRVEVRGPGNLPTTNVRVTENINSTNFNMVEPSYSTTTGRTFKITRRSGSTETDVSATQCPDIDNNTLPDCLTRTLSGGRLVGFVLTLQNVAASDRYYIYFQVTPAVLGNDVDINSSSSQIEYIGYGPTNPNRFVNIDLGEVSVVRTRSFFQTEGGNIYSGSTNSSDAIKSILPATVQYVDRSNNTIAATRGGVDWGQGNVNTHRWEMLNYSISQDEYGYNSYFSQYSKFLQLVDLTTRGPAALTRSGYYINERSPDLRLDNNWNTFRVSNRQYVIFVPGDLYIDRNIVIDKNAAASLTFVVQGNVGIHPSVNRVEGVFLVDGVVDTLCSGNFTNRDCPPGSTSNVAANSLVLEGVFYSKNQGFKLERRGTTSTQPGELFVLRPDMFLSTSELMGRQIMSWKESSE